MAGLLITGIYILKAIQKVLHGPLGAEWQGAGKYAHRGLDEGEHAANAGAGRADATHVVADAGAASTGHGHRHVLNDINFTEILGVAPLMGAMLVLGIYPALALNMINVGVQGLLR
jgi:NADH:ubiquinone oxidoreductase subunit 4 (subunit M)